MCVVEGGLSCRYPSFIRQHTRTPTISERRDSRMCVSLPLSDCLSTSCGRLPHGLAPPGKTTREHTRTFCVRRTDVLINPPAAGSAAGQRVCEGSRSLSVWTLVGRRRMNCWRFSPFSSPRYSSSSAGRGTNCVLFFFCVCV